MGMESSNDILSVQLKALQAADTPIAGALPISSTLSRLTKHGGLYSLLDRDALQARVAPLLMRESSAARSVLTTFAGPTGGAEPKALAVPAVTEAISQRIVSFFTRLVPGAPCALPSGLMSHLSMPPLGRTYTSPDMERKPKSFDSKNVPAAFTFVGQFIDHDLTLNALNLFEPQAVSTVDSASPLIDLDSVYGPRSVLAGLATMSEMVFDDKGRFRLDTTRPGVIDVPRARHRDTHVDEAVIFDGRNDENQMILQVHLLVMRLHNAMVGKVEREKPGMGGTAARDLARVWTILNWQSFVIHDYLRKIIRHDVLTFVLDEIVKPDFGAIKHKPLLDLANKQLIVTMPHEFAIGFRMGHSQLRPGYEIQKGVGVPLFNNRLTVQHDPDGMYFDDLRGGQKLRIGHQIDWPFFFKSQLANGIDSHVTSVVFDLPESAIPDEIKFVGNLVHRNLIRSAKVGLCSGEALATFYGLKPSETLDKKVIEPDATAHSLFETGGSFATPLWYYLLKESEHEAGGGPVQTLGALGSRLVAEVIVGAIAYNLVEINYFKTPHAPAVWSITGKPEVGFDDILNFVTADTVPPPAAVPMP